MSDPFESLSEAVGIPVSDEGASMMADRHQYRPVAANEGGHIRSDFTPYNEPHGRLMGDLRGYKKVAQPRTCLSHNKLAEGFEPPTC